ncbi:hypothetical protein ACTWPB_01410 [Nocardia sp. IBHARD005]|uniref:hypothetical protein n=1 Tax=Nocardia sp. IBHARD005 TaxID=3457765 RepID=UPI004059C00F
MAGIELDYGQAQTAALTAAARAAGTLNFDPHAVDELVALYDRMIAGLQAVRVHLQTASKSSGFGDIPTADALAKGFSDKATDGIAVIDKLVDGAVRLQEAFLCAGGRLEDADMVNSARIRVAEASLPGGPA